MRKLFLFILIFIFNINFVNADDNLARLFWIATQWTGTSYQYYSSANSAIDWDLNTYNHTDSSDNNWLQIYIPGLISTSKISIQWRNSNTHRLNNAKVYVLSNDYNSFKNLGNEVATLMWNWDKQEFNFKKEVLWNYILVKADNWQNLHIAEIEIYGTTKKEPIFNNYKKSHLISHKTKIGSLITTVNALDYQNNTITYSLIWENLPFEIDWFWKITTKALLKSWTYILKVLASDWKNSSTSSNIEIKVTEVNVVENALNTGIISNITEWELLDATLDEIEKYSSVMKNEKIKIFNLEKDGTPKSDWSSLTNINWDPTHDSSTFFTNVKYNRNSNFLTTNSDLNNRKNIGIIWKKGKWNYIIFWWNPFRNTINDDMDKLLENSLSWLIWRDNLKTWPNFHVTLTHLDQSYYFPDELKIREWLSNKYSNWVSYNKENTCDNLTLQPCIDSWTDLIIISQVSSNTDNINKVSEIVDNALTRGTPVLYIHHDWNLKALWSKLFSDVFDIWYQGDNYWESLKFIWYNPANDISELPLYYKRIKKLFTSFKADNLSFDWSKCKNRNWDFSENYSICNDVPGLSEVTFLLWDIRTKINRLDEENRDIFSKPWHTLQKLLILSADKFREKIVFPMDKVSTNDTKFIKSYYSDHVVFNTRNVNPAQNDLWNFSRSNFSHITPVNKTIDYTSKIYFRSAWVYAIPWKTFKVTRNDNSNLDVKIFINSLRSGSTHEYSKDSYIRPKYLQSIHYNIKPWETIALTTPYWWPIQLEFSTNDLPVQLSFENVWEHPYWKSSKDNVSFSQKLEAWGFDWAEISTPWFEVHSKLDKMKYSVSNWWTAEKLANATSKYIGTSPLVLAGFKWPWLDIIPEIHDFASSNNLIIHNIDKVQHMNADQATCWYGCSWNPYDAGWSFSPIWHWDIHEFGHGLEKHLFRFEWFEGHSVTNPYSYYTKTKYHKDTWKEPSCQNLPFQEMFNKIKLSLNQDDSISYLKSNLRDKSWWDQQFMVTLQAMMHAEKEWKLKNGWHLLSRLHILERNIYDVKKDWDNKKSNIGFSTYSLSEFNNIKNNDWMLISLSYAAWLDYSEYLKMMWIKYSDKALIQVKSFNYPLVWKSFFLSTGNWYCKSDIYWAYLSKKDIVMTSNVVWPTSKDICPKGDYTSSNFDWKCGEKPKDNCPNWDFTWNYYDWICWSKSISTWGGSWLTKPVKTCTLDDLLCKKVNNEYRYYKKTWVVCNGGNIQKLCYANNEKTFTKTDFRKNLYFVKIRDNFKVIQYKKSKYNPLFIKMSWLIAKWKYYNYEKTLLIKRVNYIWLYAFKFIENKLSKKERTIAKANLLNSIEKFNSDYKNIQRKHK